MAETALKWLKRILGAAAVLVLVTVAILLAKSNPDPWSESEIKQLVAGLNEAAAIGVPHDFLMKPETRNDNLHLLQKVETGQELTAAESMEYRHLYQNVLRDNQKFLAAFDAELTVMPDHAMQTANNVSALGIPGQHDHHDVSARANFAGLLASLQRLNAATTAIDRIVNANAAQKDLVDLISHMGVAPHTVSVPYVPPDQPWPDQQLGQYFENMMMAYKAAQFENVNSAKYWLSVDGAMANYAALISAVQNQVVDHTSQWERRIAGRFNATQTLAPPVSLSRPLRRK